MKKGNIRAGHIIRVYVKFNTMQGSIAILVTRDVRESYRDVNGNQIDKLLSEIVKIKTQTIVV